ncbi:hypothetical protein ADIWIN_0874 [Winogradskyella psychrotolerans RS-3]|uniref:Tox-MPTase3 domain-containing protein n=2 Tax=Winogradskyella TaxID=286104 RepID=S7VUU6_9FLAO|nr:hypothetical protein ADIWIN_0874 [Winogradskyella psychrotolerans RS-3]
MVSVLETYYANSTYEDGVIKNGIVYYNDLDGNFIDAYKVETGIPTKRYIPSPLVQQAGFFMFILLQDFSDIDCWNTDNLPGDGQLDEVVVVAPPQGHNHNSVQVIFINNYIIPTTGSGSSGGSGGGGGSNGNSNPRGCGTTNEVTCYPMVKYPPALSTQYKEDYPKLTEYLKNQLPTIKDNSTIVNAIKAYTDLTTAQIEQHLEWGEGPIVEIVQLDSFCTTCNSDTYGLFQSSSNPDTLYIDIDLVNDLENSTPNSVLANSFAFLVGVTILHEYVHYGDNLDGTDYPGEEGQLFEEDVYGQTVWRSNAQTILTSN